MASSESTNKRRRTLAQSQSGENYWRSQSYSQSRKQGEVPEQYTAAYEQQILTKGLDMSRLKGQELVSEASKKICIDLQQVSHKMIGPISFPNEAIGKVIDFCQNRNEAIVSRDVTPIIIPPIKYLVFGGDSSLEHVIDEVNADWHGQCVIEGPRPRPDLAIGLFASAFTEEEIKKLKNYSSVDNWAQMTAHMFFPFLMCEIKCGNQGLDIADRQNMHSCSVAVRALLRIEQEADRYRSPPKMNDLVWEVVVFSISHDHEDARLYGHYAVVDGQKWTYYRYRIRKFDLTDNDSLLAIHNFVRNILNSYMPGLVRRLKDALSALPDPNELLESGTPSASSELSFAASEIPLHDDCFQQDSLERDADGFLVPDRPANLQNSKIPKEKPENWLIERMNGLVAQNDRQIERTSELLGEIRRQKQEHKEEIERLREEHKKEMDRLIERMDQLLEENRRQRPS